MKCYADENFIFRRKCNESFCLIIDDLLSTNFVSILLSLLINSNIDNLSILYNILLSVYILFG